MRHGSDRLVTFPVMTLATALLAMGCVGESPDDGEQDVTAGPLGPSNGTKYYVDKDDAGCRNDGPGSTSQPFCKIQAAFDRVKAGDVVRIRQAKTPYDEEAIAKTSGTASKPITIEADAGHQPTLRYTGKGASTAAIVVRNLSYYRIQNLIFDGTGVQTSKCALIISAAKNDVQGFEVLNNTFRNWGGSEDNALGSRALYLSAANGWVAHGALIEGNLFEGNRERSLDLNTVGDAIVRKNEVRGARCGQAPNGTYRAEGMKFGRWNGTERVFDFPPIIVTENYVHDYADPSQCSRDMDANGIYCDYGAEGGKVFDNVVANIAGKANGIHVESRCHRWDVHHNVVIDMGEIGIKLRNTNDTKVLNNTVVMDEGLGIDLKDGARSVIKNNIVHGAKTGINVRTLAIEDGGHQIDYNLYFNPGATMKNVYGHASAPFSSWKDVCKCDAHAIGADPKFVNSVARDFALEEGSPAVDRGTKVGLPFLGSAPDLGAKEK